MAERTDSTLNTLSEALEEQRALLTEIRESQAALHELITNIASRFKRLEQEHTVARTLLRRMEERFERQLRERVGSLDKRATTLESSRR